MTNQTINKSFILHKDSLSVLNKLSDDEAGKLFKAIFDYQQNKNLPKNNLISIVFEPFLNQFIRDERNYIKTCEARKLAGSIGGKQKVANATKSKQKVANLADNDSKNKNDSENDSKNKNDSENDLQSKSECKIYDVYDELADGLKFIVETNLNRTIKSTNGWRNEIKKLIENDLKPRNNALEDVKKAIQAIADHSANQYFPVVQSASSLREKFAKIEAYLIRNKPAQTNNSNSTFRNLMEKYSE